MSSVLTSKFFALCFLLTLVRRFRTPVCFLGSCSSPGAAQHLARGRQATAPCAVRSFLQNIAAGLQYQPAAPAEERSATRSQALRTPPSSLSSQRAKDGQFLHSRGGAFTFTMVTRLSNSDTCCSVVNIIWADDDCTNDASFPSGVLRSYVWSWSSCTSRGSTAFGAYHGNSCQYRPCLNGQFNNALSLHRANKTGQFYTTLAAC